MKVKIVFTKFEHIYMYRNVKILLNRQTNKLINRKHKNMF